MIRYEEIAPARAEEEEPAEEPKTARLLDDIARFYEAHVVARQAHVTAAVLFAAMTWAAHPDKDASPFPTLPRVLFVGEAESGKTTAMNVTAALSANPTDADGTYADLRAALLESKNETEDKRRTFFYDEIGGVYGDSGMNKGGNRELDKLLRKGYKAGAESGRSSNGTRERYSLFFPVLMTGRKIAIPVDIRGRTIVNHQEAGEPARYFDARESEKEARNFGAALGVAVGAHVTKLQAFRARGIHPKLIKRRLEVWEPLFAVASVLGGQRWLNRCRDAFLELALSSDRVALSPRQQVLQDVAGLLETAFAGQEFVGGLALIDEVKRLDNPLYEDRSDAALARLISEAMPVNTSQVRIGGQKTRGYFAREITKAWEDVRPDDPEDAEISEEENLFAQVDDDDDDAPGGTGGTVIVSGNGTGGTGGTGRKTANGTSGTGGTPARKRRKVTA